MKILVAGAAGAIGEMLTRDLAKAGHEVTGLVHSDEKMDKVLAAGATPLKADVTDRASLDAPVAAADVVIFAAGSGGKAVEAVDRDGAINMIDAAKDAGTQRFVMLSSMYADKPESGPDQLQDYLMAKQAADEHLAQSGLDYTIVRPGPLDQEAATGRVEIAVSVDHENPHIARADVASVLAAVAVRQDTVGKTFEVVAGDQSVAEAVASLASRGP